LQTKGLLNDGLAVHSVALLHMTCMEDRSMQDSLEDIVQGLGGALVAPGLGSAELVIAALVACAFLLGALYSLFIKGDSRLEWWER
jgi:hypothetical protein